MKKPFTEKEVRGFVVIRWERLGKDVEGSVLNSMDLDIMSISIDGEGGDFFGGHVVIEGAISDTFYPLSAPNGSLLSYTRPEIVSFSGRYPKIRPKVFNGTDKTNITVSMFCQKIEKKRSGR